MGLKAYRFSIAWARIIPKGTGEVSQEGVEYYKSLIDELILNGIEPSVTLYHWDLPEALQQRGGWTNPDIAHWFEEYASVCFSEFGYKVKRWITLNEPWVTSVEGHGLGVHAPGIKSPGILDYVTAHNQIRAHAKAYRIYKREFAESQKGQVGITLNVNWFEPLDFKNESHVEASNTIVQFMLGWFANPILVNGDYPEIMKKKIAEKSEQQGFNTTRLPEFTEQEKSEISGSSDFLGINHYTTGLVFPTNLDSPDNDKMGWPYDSGVSCTVDKKWYPAASSWLKVVPFGLRRVLNWIKNEYGNKWDIYITENGFSDYQGNLDDQHRIYYYKHYINQLLKAVELDGCNVKGYFAWSLLDNFEWARGYTEKFGLHSVDFDDPARPRRPKASAGFISKIAADNGFVI